MNLTDLFRIHWLNRPDQPAILFENRVLTFGDLDRESNRLAHALRHLGLEKGDRAVLHLYNSLEFVVAYLANLKLGLVTVPMNTLYRDTEIAHILSDAAPRMVLTDRTLLPVLEPLLPATPVERVLVSDQIEEMSSKEPATDLPSPVQNDDIAILMYTSGTTGRSKGAMLSHNNLVSNITALVMAWGWSARDRLLLALPLFHMHGLGVALHGALTVGCPTILHRTFQPARVLDALQDQDVTLFMGVPTMYVRLLQEAKGRGLDQVRLPQMRLCVSGSGPLSVETFRAFETIFGQRILERYGMTETAMNLSNLYAGPRIPGTVGVPLPGVQVRIVDELGQAAPDGQIGEVLLRGPNIFRGYWRAPDKTREAFTIDADHIEWFRTGDLGKRDPETGYYTLVGRKHDLIITGGYNVYPREVEELLTSHAGVSEAAVVGLPEPAKGEIPVAFVVRREDVLVSEQELIDHCKTHLARFKVPHQIKFVASLPRNAMGKLEKHKLRLE